MTGTPGYHASYRRTLGLRNHTRLPAESYRIGNPALSTFTEHIGAGSLCLCASPSRFLRPVLALPGLRDLSGTAPVLSETLDHALQPSHDVFVRV